MPTPKVMSLALLLGSVAFAQTWEIKGQVAGWPAGKTAILRAHPGIAQVVMVLKPRALAQTTIGKDGRFTLKMPLKPSIPVQFMERTHFGPNCQVKITPGETSIGPISFLVYDQKGEVLDTLDLKVPGEKPTLVQFMYASKAANIVGKCEAQGQPRVQVALNYQAGWNLMVVGPQGKDIAMSTVQQTPAGIEWVAFHELWHLKNPEAR